MSEEFIFPDIDEIGIDTLDAISFAPNFNEYMYKTILPFCKGNILEIGSGIGNISHHFINTGSKITLTDIRSNYVEQLKEKYDGKAHDILEMDLVHPKFDEVYADYLNSFDTIFAMNVVEHIEDDNQAIINAKKMLTKDGHLIILVPAYQTLYNSFDLALEHFRRYTKKRLNHLMSPHLKLIHTQYFNVFGILGWFVSGKLLKKKSIPVNQMKLYDKLILVSKTLDKIVLNKVGLSVITVGKK